MDFLSELSFTKEQATLLGIDLIELSEDQFQSKYRVSKERVFLKANLIDALVTAGTMDGLAVLYAWFQDVLKHQAEGSVSPETPLN